MQDRNTPLIGLYAASAALAAVVFSPLLALAYMSTSEGAYELHSATVSWWAKPALHHAGDLATWASPGRTYATYTQAIALLFPAVFLCARAARRTRHTTSRGERWGWRIALAGYGLAGVGLLAVSLTLVPADPDSPALNVVFPTLLVPGLLLSVAGSTVLGIALLRGGYRPRATAWLLALAIPLFAGGSILGHNSLGLVPLMVAWGLTGLDLRRHGAQAIPTLSTSAIGEPEGA